MDCKVFLEAEDYSKHHRLVQEMVRDAVSSFFPVEQARAVAGGVSILDLGCATGENILSLGRMLDAKSIVGVDWNEKFLRFAASRQPGDGPQLELVKANLNDVDWPTPLLHRRFDIVTSFLTLHWIKNLTNCLDGMRRSMTPGQTLMFHVVGIRPGASFQMAMRELAASSRWGATVKGFLHATRWQDPTVADWRVAADPAKAFADILTSAGFDVSLCTKMPFKYTTESEEECRGHLKWLVPFAGALEAAEQQELLDDFMRAYSSRAPQVAAGRFVWDNEVLVVLGRRRQLEPAPASGCQ